jgi:hypothetical protein
MLQIYRPNVGRKEVALTKLRILLETLTWQQFSSFPVAFCWLFTVRESPGRTTNCFSSAEPKLPASNLF